MIMNVSPSEFSFIHSIQFSPDFAGIMHNYFTCKYYGNYRIVVRKDVPSVPWFTAGVKRFEPEPESGERKDGEAGG